MFDGSGRLAERRLVGLLGWSAGTRVSIEDVDGIVVVRESGLGKHTLVRRGMVAIPSSTRQRCGFGDRDQVLLVAQPARSALLVLGVEVLDQVVRDVRARVDACQGDPRPTGGEPPGSGSSTAPEGRDE
ncbi:hypothetical protein [Actinokineospora pegani]|uniref:hypothetical protein n=1 Tax=Actinokineospora pegani TaxID=2654637 RepID=UPI0012E9B4BD|nr:hypothetical protein [Actinokineospora pegani]